MTYELTDTEETIPWHNEYDQVGIFERWRELSPTSIQCDEFGLNALYVLHTVVPRRMFCRRNGRGRKPTSEASVSVFAYGLNLRARQAE